ncbi:MAG: alpha/beta fold hydrolase [Candidatus Omnitrophota bacterium]
MKQRQVRFKSGDGISLCGILTVPDKRPKGAAIMTHGITAEKNECGFYIKLAELFAENGLASLRFDFRGHGESSGKLCEMTIKGEIGDIEAAASFLKTQGHGNFAIIGTSFGGGSAVLYAKKYPNKVSSMVLIYPVLDYKKTFLDPKTQWAEKWFTPQALAKAKLTGKLAIDSFEVGERLIEEFHRYDPGKSLLKLSIPTLIVHGTEDTSVPYSVSRYYGRHYKKGRLLSIKGADHGFVGYEEKIFPIATRWILKYLKNS